MAVRRTMAARSLSIHGGNWKGCGVSDCGGVKTWKGFSIVLTLALALGGGEFEALG
jgi:hypothetical protein